MNASVRNNHFDGIFKMRINVTTSEDFSATHSRRISTRRGLLRTAEARNAAAVDEVEQHRNPCFQFAL